MAATEGLGLDRPGALHPAEMVNDVDVEVSLEFVDDADFKQGKIVVNGRDYSINVYDRIWSQNVTRSVKGGNNAVKIVPRTIMDIINLKVDLVER